MTILDKCQKFFFVTNLKYITIFLTKLGVRKLNKKNRTMSWIQISSDLQADKIAFTSDM